MSEQNNNKKENRIDIIWLISGVAMIALGYLLAMLTIKTGYDGLTFKFLILTLSGLFPALVGVWRIHKRPERAKLAAEMAAQKAAQKEKEEKDKLNEFEKFYNACIKHNITSIDTPEKVDNLMIIASNFGIQDAEAAKEYFIKASTAIQEKNEKDVQEELNQQREEEKEEFDLSKEIAQINGKEKYLKELKENNKLSLEIQEFIKESKSRAYSKSTYYARQKSPVFSGAIASGIAGDAVGVAAAMKTVEENKSAKERAQEVRDNAKLKSKELDEKYTYVTSLIHLQSDIIKFVEDKLCDSTNQQEKYEMLTFSDWKFELLETGNLLIKSKIKVNGSVKIFDKPAILDGALKIDVFDGENKHIATTYYCAPGYNEMLDVSNIGFKNGEKLSAVCITNGTVSKTDLDKLTCKVSYVNMWSIEDFSSDPEYSRHLKNIEKKPIKIKDFDIKRINLIALSIR